MGNSEVTPGNDHQPESRPNQVGPPPSFPSFLVSSPGLLQINSPCAHTMESRFNRYMGEIMPLHPPVKNQAETHLALAPEFQSPAVARCCKAWNRAFKAHTDAGTSSVWVPVRANEAYRSAMPRSPPLRTSATLLPAWPTVWLSAQSCRPMPPPSSMRQESPPALSSSLKARPPRAVLRGKIKFPAVNCGLGFCRRKNNNLPGTGLPDLPQNDPKSA